MIKEFKVGDFKCVDDGETRGLIMSVGPRSYITLVFDKTIPHKQTDELRAVLEKMKLNAVLVETPDSKPLAESHGNNPLGWMAT